MYLESECNHGGNTALKVAYMYLGLVALAEAFLPLLQGVQQKSKNISKLS